MKLTLYTERLILRPWTMDDAEPMFSSWARCIAVFITYVDMLSISMNNICVIISNFRQRRYKANALLIVGMVFQFIFCLDILGAIFTYLDCNKQEGYLCNL